MKTGDPVPAGLLAFASTTFVLSCYTAGVTPASAPVNYITGLALFHGGLVQLLVGLCEMLRHNTLSATIFTSFSAFWLSYSAILLPSFGVSSAYPDPAVFGRAVSIFLAAWAIWTLLLTLASLSSSPPAMILLFLSALLTFILLSASSFVGAARSVSLHRSAGFAGILTALTAFYNGMHILLASMERLLPLWDSSPNYKESNQEHKQDTIQQGSPPAPVVHV